MGGPATITKCIHHFFQRNYPSIYALLLAIPQIPIQQRKELLNACQQGFHDPLLFTIHGSFSDPKQWVTPDVGMSRDILIDAFYTIERSAVLRSFISMVLRNEGYEGEEASGSAEVAYQETVCKEITAAITEFSGKQVLNYSTMCGGRNERWSEWAPMQTPWITMATQYVRVFMARIDAKKLWFPTVQRKKNMSRETAERLYEDGYRRPDMEWKNFRTVDLELHYAQTGRMITGATEMRTAWRYNELKPRAYYAAGGTTYWASRYMRDIAVEMMECCSVTQKELRQDPTHLSYYIDPEEDVYLWDYSAFTSTLSELKYFLFWLALTIRDEGDVVMNLVDYREGISPRLLSDMILEYNEVVNQYPTFSVVRLKEMMVLDGEELTSVNNGQLGVHGNIGFSTSLHGLHIEALAGRPNKGVCVGDDAKMGTRVGSRVLLGHLSQIGVVHPEKVGMLQSVQDYETVRSKFLKRGYYRTYDGFSIDKLFNFPAMAIALGFKQKLRSGGLVTIGERRRYVIGVVGPLLWEMNTHSNIVSDGDVRIVWEVLSRLYRELGLPTKGMLPGPQTCHLDIGPSTVVPPTNFDPRFGDWAEEVWERSHALPYTVINPDLHHTSIPIYAPGGRFIASRSAVVLMMEDLEVVERGKCVTEIIEVIESNRRRYLQSIHGVRIHYEYYYLKQPGDFLAEIIGYLYPSFTKSFEQTELFDTGYLWI